MSKFKVGDKVRRILGLDGDATYGVVVETNLNSRIDVQLTAPAGPYAAGHIYLGNSSFWELLEEDDELPPVPDSVSYLKENGRRKLVARINGDSVNVLLSLSYRGITDAVGYNMEPDAALQLAHDLRRMAMDIKRKGKAQ